MKLRPSYVGNYIIVDQWILDAMNYYLEPVEIAMAAFYYGA